MATAGSTKTDEQRHREGCDKEGPHCSFPPNLCIARNNNTLFFRRHERERILRTRKETFQADTNLLSLPSSNCCSHQHLLSHFWALLRNRIDTSAQFIEQYKYLSFPRFHSCCTTKSCFSSPLALAQKRLLSSPVAP